VKGSERSLAATLLVKAKTPAAATKINLMFPSEQKTALHRSVALLFVQVFFAISGGPGS
jgi:hypothetical protein